MFALNHRSEYLFFANETAKHGLELFLFGYFSDLGAGLFFEEHNCNFTASTYLSCGV